MHIMHIIIHCHNFIVIQLKQYVSFVHDFRGQMSVYWNVDFNYVHDDVSIEKDMVWKLFCGVKERKSTRPEGIRGRVLKNCALQLADIFSYIFQLSLKLHTVPCLWKDSVIVPVPKI